MSVYFCGGSCVEDVTSHLMRHLSDVYKRQAQLFSSPWATIESTAMDSEGYIDLSQMADIYVIAQDGVTKQKYTLIRERIISLYWYPMILRHL